MMAVGHWNVKEYARIKSSVLLTFDHIFHKQTDTDIAVWLHTNTDIAETDTNI